MTDDSLPAAWMTDEGDAGEALVNAMNAVVERDRSSRNGERSVRIALLFAAGVLCPALIWCAANGITPLVRGGYGLMAAGTAILVATEWMYLALARQALPGPVDARSQLQKTGFLLSRKAMMMRSASLWCGPIFLGTALIGGWLYEERSPALGYGLWTIVGAAWFVVGVKGRSMGRELDQRRSRIEQLLNDLT